MSVGEITMSKDKEKQETDFMFKMDSYTNILHHQCDMGEDHYIYLLCATKSSQKKKKKIMSIISWDSDWTLLDLLLTHPPTPTWSPHGLCCAVTTSPGSHPLLIVTAASERLCTLRVSTRTWHDGCCLSPWGEGLLNGHFVVAAFHSLFNVGLLKCTTHLYLNCFALSDAHKKSLLLHAGAHYVLPWLPRDLAYLHRSPKRSGVRFPRSFVDELLECIAFTPGINRTRIHFERPTFSGGLGPALWTSVH